jgi:hypothetical protein
MRSKSPVNLAVIAVAISLVCADRGFAQLDSTAHAVALDGYRGKIPFDGSTIANIKDAASAFLSGLSAAQLALAQSPVDANSWQQWTNLPATRTEGIAFGALSEPQIRAAHQLLLSALSANGYARANGTMLADDTLTDMGNLNFGSERYWLKIYGEPSTDEKWGFQLEGHHYTANVIIVGNQLTMTPSFLGTEPVRYNLEVDGQTVPQTPYLPIVTKSYELVQSLGAAAVVAAAGMDIRSTIGGTYNAANLAPEGVAGSQMNETQRGMLMDLIGEHMGVMADSYAQRQLSEVAASLDSTRFSWRGGTSNPFGEAVYFRIHGPDVLIESVLNRGVGAQTINHLHAILRDPKNDYGVGFVLGTPGDVNGDGQVDVSDINQITTAILSGSMETNFDVNGDGKVNADDRSHWVTTIRKTWFGDSNLDGEFNSGDLVQIFQAGKFEADVDAGWEDGDWDGDRRFGTGDLVDAFQGGGYEQGPKQAQAVPEPTSFLLIAGMIVAGAYVGRARE